jgi:hypothetical protein
METYEFNICGFKIRRSLRCHYVAEYVTHKKYVYREEYIDKFKRYHVAVRTKPNEGSRNTSRRPMASIPLFVERTSVSKLSSPRMQFYECLHQHTAEELFVHNILRTDEVCFAREGACGVRNSHVWARDNARATRESECQVRFSVKCLDWYRRDHCRGLYLLPDRLTAQRYRDLLRHVLPGMLEGVPLATRQRLLFQHDGAPVHYGKDGRQ